MLASQAENQRVQNRMGGWTTGVIVTGRPATNTMNDLGTLILQLSVTPHRTVRYCTATLPCMGLVHVPQTMPSSRIGSFLGYRKMFMSSVWY